MKKSLQKKLMKYSLTAAAVVSTGTVVQGQVYYSNLVDTVSGHYEIDIDGNNNNDYSFGVANSAVSTTSGMSYLKYVNISNLDTNEWIQTNKKDINNYLVKPLNSGVSINSSGNWGHEFKVNNMGKSVNNNTFTPQNFFIAEGDKYIGIKLSLADGVHFGWIRVNVMPSTTTVRIRDWAYEQTAGKSIKTGQTTSLNDYSGNDINIVLSPNPANDLLTINADENYFVEIININGKILKTVQMTEKNAKIDINELQKGLYIAKLTGKENTKTLKFVKE